MFCLPSATMNFRVGPGQQKVPSAVLVALRAQGMNITQIAGAVGQSPASIRERLRRIGTAGHDTKRSQGL